MNERQPYEQHLAEKLQQLPPPQESDKTWEQMKVLLDNELPRGTGAGGNGRWWIIGMVAGILLIGTWWFIQQPDETTAAKELTAIEKTAPRPGNAQPGHSSESRAEQNQLRPGNNSEVNLPENGDQAASATRPDMSAARRSNYSGGNHQNPALNTNKANSDAARTEQQVITNKQQSGRKFPPPRDPVVTDQDIGQRTTPVKIIDQHKLPAYTENSTQPATENKLQNDQTEKPGNKRPSKSVLDATGAEYKPIHPGAANADLVGSMPVLANAEQSAIQTLQILPNRLPSPSEMTDALAIYLAPGTNPKKMKRKSETRERAFAIGLSLPLAFPVADQKALGYNFRGGANTVSDYIPSPHIQYHLNRRTYFQTEIQVIAPQYIRPILLYQEKTPDGPDTWMYNSVFAKKLYYFNLPVSVYHSPMPNFFLGTGLQFSSLVSGLGMYENKKVYNNQETILRQQYNRISHDSLTSRMNNSEIRLLLDVNYYWQKFTVGLRYNQAFGNYIGFRLNNTTGYTYDKNKALFFYLRYNIWEDSKRKKPSKSMLSLK